MKFDYVIVGGGSAGSTLASRLSEDPAVTVCVLEAGGQGDGVLVRAPAGIAVMLPGRPKINNWAFETVPQAGLKGRRGFQPRGKALGGSSAINAMLYTRGHSSDYDDWANLGCEGWSYRDVLPYFLRSEANERGADSWHGDSGPLQVCDQRSPRPISHAFIQAASELQFRTNDDFNGPEQEGVGLYQVTQFHNRERNGERCSAAAAYLHPHSNRPNLAIVTKAHATKIEFEGKQATGVRYRVGGAEKRVEPKREIILCGGAFNSPQLLQLSGVGRPDDLRRHGIDVAHELAGVGQNLRDHLDFILAYKSKDTDLLGIGAAGTVALVKHILQWRKDGTGLIASPGAEVGAFLKTDRSLARPDIQLHFVVSIIDDHARKLHLGYGYSCHVCVLRPRSTGEVFLESPDPMAAPGIDPRYLSNAHDLQVLIKGAKMTRAILEGPAMAKFRHKEIYTRDGMSDAEWEDHIRSRADTVYHPVGTCKMGVDDMAV
ncbi:MAG TPA: GMC family oxidoreductase N-terminal domain-containing protein, partial [Roseiarcus sp.]|nr:GMC family oxidoreductase N-terminal domain-containing protein [Roseiarcus sp.]